MPSIRGGVLFSFVGDFPHTPLRGCYTLALPVGVLYPHTPILFYYKSAPSVAGAAATLGAIL